MYGEKRGKGRAEESTAASLRGFIQVCPPTIPPNSVADFQLHRNGELLIRTVQARRFMAWQLLFSTSRHSNFTTAATVDTSLILSVSVHSRSIICLP